VDLCDDRSNEFHVFDMAGEPRVPVKTMFGAGVEDLQCIEFLQPLLFVSVGDGVVGTREA
jgi:hypothetical protein